MKARHLLLGVLFGFLLVRVGATDPAAITGMFLVEDLHLAGVMSLAIAVLALGFLWVRRARPRAWSGEPVSLEAKPMRPGLIGGGLLFGAGWAIAGTCPGTALAQVGEGRVAGLVTFAGILAGVWLWGRVERVRAAPAATPPAPPAALPACPRSAAG
jgi:hypothetical protein